jgi:hypothetical protein
MGTRRGERRKLIRSLVKLERGEKSGREKVIGNKRSPPPLFSPSLFVSNCHF